MNYKQPAMTLLTEIVNAGRKEGEPLIPVGGFIVKEVRKYPGGAVAKGRDTIITLTGVPQHGYKSEKVLYYYRRDLATIVPNGEYLVENVGGTIVAGAKVHDVLAKINAVSGAKWLFTETDLENTTLSADSGGLVAQLKAVETASLVYRGIGKLVVYPTPKTLAEVITATVLDGFSEA